MNRTILKVLVHQRTKQINEHYLKSLQSVKHISNVRNGGIFPHIMRPLLKTTRPVAILLPYFAFIGQMITRRIEEELTGENSMRHV